MTLNLGDYKVRTDDSCKDEDADQIADDRE